MTAPAPRPKPALPAAETLRKIYIPGLCGTAMGTLGAMLKERGYEVSGSDPNPYPPMSDWLADRGLFPDKGWDAANVPEDLDLMIVGNVCRRDNVEVVRAQELGIPTISLPEALDHFIFSKTDAPKIVITGTHGKTTTCGLAAWLLEDVGDDPSYFIGGLTGNASTSYRFGEGPFIIEGDEYDTAFFDKVPKYWHYPSTHATINNIEFDHADIYPDIDSIRHVFKVFAEQAAREGELWVNGDDPLALEAATYSKAKVRTFGMKNEQVTLHASVLQQERQYQLIRLTHEDGWSGELKFPLMGDFNVQNLLAALGVVWATGVDRDASLRAAERFRAVRKRQEWKGEVDGIDVFDDFAHHPTAVRGTLAAMRARFPDRRLIAIFEAKSNSSRRAVFQDAWPEALSLADRVYLARPWRDDPLPEHEKISLDKVIDDLARKGVPTERFAEVSEIVDAVIGELRPGDLVIGLSGGSFGGIHDMILERLRERADS